MFDIGFNCTSSRFSKDRDEVISRAFSSGLSGMIITGTTLRKSLRAKELTKKYTNCWSTSGVHPHYSNNWTEKSEEILYSLAKEKKVIAIGECGLDFYRNFSDPEKQKKAFISQLAIASELDMPVFLHLRGITYEYFFSLLDPWLNKLPGAVLHCFTGKYQDMISCLNRNLYLGITGWFCNKKKRSNLQFIIPFIPLNRLLLETDSPYLLPKDSDLKSSTNRNEPAYLTFILQQVANIRKEDANLIEKKTDDNVRNLFKINF